MLSDSHLSLNLDSINLTPRVYIPSEYVDHISKGKQGPQYTREVVESLS